MSDLSFEQMLEESLKTIRTGEVVEGTVIGVKEDEIILNIGYKADGIITRNEYTNTSNVDLTTLVHEGDKMQAKVLKVNDGDGYVMLTYKRQEYLFHQALYPIPMRRTFLSMPDRRFLLLSLSSTQLREESSVTASSF